MSESNSFILPAFLKQSLGTSVQVHFSDSAPHILMCSKDGYLYEIKNQKIVNSLNLKEIGKKIHYVHFVENEKPLLFYLVLTLNSKLLIIKRLDRHLEVKKLYLSIPIELAGVQLEKIIQYLFKVVKVYECVKSFEVDDFQSLGYPQIRIEISEKRSIVQFPVDNTKAIVDELDCETNSNTIGKTLAKKLQIVCRHVDELTEEWYSIRKLCQFNTNREDFSLLQVDCFNFSVPLENYVKKMTITNTWIKVIGEVLVLGINILNDGEEAVSDLQFKLYEKAIKVYLYRFFSNNNVKQGHEENLLFCEKINSDILPGQKITIVVAASANFCNLSFGTKLKISCYLISAKLKNYLMKNTFEISISDMIDYGNKFFPSLEKSCSVEDLQAIKTVKSETKIKIKMKNTNIDCLENVLVKNLGFVEVNTSEFKLYYCISNCLKEVFIAFRPIMNDENVLKINLYTSHETQIYFFVNALHELLPEYTTFLLQQD